MWSKRRSSRTLMVDRVRAALTKRGVRWHMGLLVVATASIGMLASFVLLTLGLHIFWLRYVLATAVAYAGFLVLVRWWLALAGATGPRTDAQDADDLATALDVLDGAAHVMDLNADAGLGGPSVPDVGALVPDIGGGGIDLPTPDDEGGCAIVAVLAVLALALLGALLAAGFLIYTAPVFFAEVFVDAALSYGLYRRLSAGEPQHWLQTAMSRTWMPFLAVAVVFGLAGAAIHTLVPDAVSIGDVWRGGE